MLVFCELVVLLFVLLFAYFWLIVFGVCCCLDFVGGFVLIICWLSVCFVCGFK